nr:hypothetical protein [Tanacetum cinerariifolium]
MFDINDGTRPHVSLGYLQQSRCVVPFLTDDTSLANDNGDDEVVEFRECVRVLAKKEQGRKDYISLEPKEVTEQLDNRTVAASSIECDTTREEVETLFNQFAKASRNPIELLKKVVLERVQAELAIKWEEDAEDSNSLDNLSGKA